MLANRIQKKPISARCLLDNVSITPQKLNQTTHLNSAMLSDLTSNALCIYLTYLLYETEGIKKICIFQLSITEWSSSNAKEFWKSAIDMAGVLSDCIECCRQSLLQDVGFLSVVDSWQEALREAVQRALNGDTHDEQSHGRLSKAYANRAKYLTYGFTANNNHDLGLSSLWHLAAENLQRRLELKYSLSITESLIDKCNQHLKTASSVDQDGIFQKCTQLSVKAVHHFRYAAALSALGHPHSHDYAAELYQRASSARGVVYEMQHPACYRETKPFLSDKLALLERAAASWQLAADMAAHKPPEATL